MSELGPGCVKTRRRSIAIEQVTRSRPFHVPTSQAHSILKSKSRISFSSRFELLSFHTAWVNRDRPFTADRDAKSELVRKPNSDGKPAGTCSSLCVNEPRSMAMQDQMNANPAPQGRVPWNKGK